MTRGFLRFLRGNTIALLALFLALGGTTYAAVSLPANSVGAKQLKKNAVINKKIKANAVTGGKVKNDSLTGADVVEGSLGKVPSAANADHATTATSATTATTAANANALGGLGPNGYQKVPTGPQHYSLGSLQYVDEDGAARAEAFNGTVGFCSNGVADRLNGAVNLPQGVTVTSLKLDYLDDSGTVGGNGTAFLTRMPLAGGGGTYLDIFAASLPNTATPGAVGSGTDTTPSVAGSNVIDNTKYNYTIIIQSLPSGAFACGTDLTYTVPSGFAAAGHTGPTSGPTAATAAWAAR